jgi:hypothetical protein
MSETNTATAPQMLHTFQVHGRTGLPLASGFTVSIDALTVREARREALRQYPGGVIHGMTIESSVVHSAEGLFAVHGRWRRKHMVTLVAAEVEGDAVAAVHKAQAHIVVTGAVPATADDITRFGFEPTAVDHEFYHWNDCRPKPLTNATHWLWQFGNTWQAVSGEDAMSWFGNEIPEEVVRRFLVHDIADIPLEGTLTYWDAEGVGYDVEASTFAPVTS